MNKKRLAILLIFVVLLSSLPAYAGDLDQDNVETTPSDESVFLTSASESGVYPYTGFNTSPSANTYCGVIYVRDDGLYDKYQYGTGNKLDIPGLEYDPSTRTLSLNNINIGCVYDDVLRRDKMGALRFHPDPSKNEYVHNYTIDLHGHNYINSCLGGANGGGDIKIHFEGEGDVTLQGGILRAQNYITELPVWYSCDDGINIRKVESLSLDSLSEYDFGLDPNYLDTGVELRSSWVRGANYVKIGGDKPVTPEEPDKYISVSKNLGNIGGHTVSVCYTDNVVYDGRKHVFCRKRFFTGSHAFFSDDKYNEGQKSYVGDMGLVVYIDDKPYITSYPDVYKSMVFKHKNNLNSSAVSEKKGVEPCFSFGFKPSSGLDSAFIKALNDYFKNNGNWIKYTILQEDMKNTGTSFVVSHKKESGYSKANIKKNLKINGDTIKKIKVFNSDIKIIKDDPSGKKVLKWDKKYNESNPNLKKDFHAKLYDDFIEITGQGNYTGTVIVTNPYKKYYEYFENYGKGGMKISESDM